MRTSKNESVTVKMSISETGKRAFEKVGVSLKGL